MSAIVKLWRMWSYHYKKSTFKKPIFKFTHISLCFWVEASKKIIIMNRDGKITYPFSNTKITLMTVQGDMLEDIPFILPVMRDRTQKSAGNIIWKAAFAFLIRESYGRWEDLVEPGWKLFMNTAEIISAPLFGRLLKLAKLVNKGNITSIEISLSS